MAFLEITFLRIRIRTYHKVIQVNMNEMEVKHCYGMHKRICVQILLLLCMRRSRFFPDRGSPIGNLLARDVGIDLFFCNFNILMRSECDV